MPAGAVANPPWAAGTWSATAWEANTWGAGSGAADVESGQRYRYGHRHHWAGLLLWFLGRL
jgi:hypothetical protein